ncbi:hypothetical protein ACTA71_006602 [Dictyostelium dimigraforme]
MIKIEWPMINKELLMINVSIIKYVPTDSSAGITVINFNPAIKLKVIKKQEGRILTFTLEIQNQTFTITAIYAPPEEQRRKQWLEIFADIDLQNSDLIIGDFNINNLNNSKHNTQLLQLTEEAGLIELIHVNDPDNPIYTHKNKIIDRAFASQRLQQCITKYSIIERILKSDHNLLSTVLSVPNYKNEKKKKQWKMNPEVVQNQETLIKTQNIIDHHSGKDKPICQKWLGLKKAIKKFSINQEYKIINDRRDEIKKLSKKYGITKSIKKN